MADDSGGGGATPFLAFLVGGLIVIVAIIGFVMYGGGLPSPSKNVNVNIKPPAPVSAPATPG